MSKNWAGTASKEYLLTEDELRQLAQLCDIKIEKNYAGDQRIYVVDEDYERQLWDPASQNTPSWQTQSVIKALEDKGLQWNYESAIKKVVSKDREEHTENFYLLATPTPRQKIRAVLNILDKYKLKLDHLDRRWEEPQPDNLEWVREFCEVADEFAYMSADVQNNPDLFQLGFGQGDDFLASFIQTIKELKSELDK